MSIDQKNTYVIGSNNDLSNALLNIDLNRIGVDLTYMEIEPFTSNLVVSVGSIIEANGSLYVVEGSAYDPSGTQTDGAFLFFDDSVPGFVWSTTEGEYDPDRGGFYDASDRRQCRWQVSGTTGLIHRSDMYTKAQRFDGKVDIGGLLHVAGNLSVGGNISGNGTLAVNGDASGIDNLEINGTITGATDITASGKLDAGGNVESAGNVLADGFGNFGGDLRCNDLVDISNAYNTIASGATDTWGVLPTDRSRGYLMLVTVHDYGSALFIFGHSFQFCTLLGGAAGFADVTSASDFCVYVSGNNLVFENRTGSSQIYSWSVIQGGLYFPGP